MLIVLEGVDGSGKQTQTGLLYERLAKEGKNILRVEFPDYNSPSSALVKQYLGGEFGSRPEDVSTYAASSFYVVDRYASYKTKWEDHLKEGGIVLADRYTTSNMIHQGCKLPEEHLDEYLLWLEDFEYVKLGIPQPDLVIFLDMPPKVGQLLTANRDNKITGQAEKDIHEKNLAYIEKSYRTALSVANKKGWQTVHCVEEGRLLSIEEIAEKIYQLAKRYENA